MRFRSFPQNVFARDEKVCVNIEYNGKHIRLNLHRSLLLEQQRLFVTLEKTMSTDMYTNETGYALFYFINSLPTESYT